MGSNDQVRLEAWVRVPPAPVENLEEGRNHGSRGSRKELEKRGDWGNAMGNKIRKRRVYSEVSYVPVMSGTSNES